MPVGADYPRLLQANGATLTGTSTSGSMTGRVLVTSFGGASAFRTSCQITGTVALHDRPGRKRERPLWSSDPGLDLPDPEPFLQSRSERRLRISLEAPKAPGLAKFPFFVALETPSE
jgi:hypothetical protein